MVQSSGTMGTSNDRVLLKLTITPHLEQWIQENLIRAQETRTRSQASPKKQKAGHFPMSLLMIGSFRVLTTFEGDLVGKCYYAKRKLVWEILKDCSKRKIEIQWDKISAMRAILQEDQPGILLVELESEPMFYCEVDPQPGKHTTWRETTDFTEGEATKVRWHYLEFPPGVLDQHYEQLIRSDNRLLKLSEGLFPRCPSPFFNAHLYQGATYFSFGHDRNGWSITTSAGEQQQLQPVLPTQQAQMTIPAGEQQEEEEAQPVLPTQQAQMTTPAGEQQQQQLQRVLPTQQAQMITPASEQQQLQPVLPTQQVQLFGITMPSYLIGIDNATSPPSDFRPPPDGAIHNLSQLDFWSQTLDDYGIFLATDSGPCASDVLRNGPGSNHEDLSELDKILLTEHCGPQVKSLSTLAAVSMEADPAYGTDISTQIDRPNNGVNSWEWDALINVSEEQNSAGGANVQPMLRPQGLFC